MLAAYLRIVYVRYNCESRRKEVMVFCFYKYHTSFIMTKLKLIKNKDSDNILRVRAVRAIRAVTDDSIGDVDKIIREVINGNAKYIYVEFDDQVADIIKELAECGIIAEISKQFENDAKPEEETEEETVERERHKSDIILDKIFKFHDDLFEKNEKIAYALLGLYVVIVIGLLIYDWTLVVGIVFLLAFAIGWDQMSKKEKEKAKDGIKSEALNVLKIIFNILKVVAVIVIILAVIFLPPTAVFKIGVIVLIIFLIF